MDDLINRIDTVNPDTGKIISACWTKLPLQDRAKTTGCNYVSGIRFVRVNGDYKHFPNSGNGFQYTI